MVASTKPLHLPFKFYQLQMRLAPKYIPTLERFPSGVPSWISSFSQELMGDAEKNSQALHLLIDATGKDDQEPRRGILASQRRPISVAISTQIWARFCFLSPVQWRAIFFGHCPSKFRQALELVPHRWEAHRGPRLPSADWWLEIQKFLLVPYSYEYTRYSKDRLEYKVLLDRSQF